jgi:hypothetical protein
MGEHRMTDEQLQALLRANTEATIKAVKEAMPHQVAPNPDSLRPKQQSEEEAFAAAMLRPIADRSLHLEQIFHCLTSKGATFDAVVDYPKVDGKPHPLYPHGRVLRLENYHEPEFTRDGKPESLVGPRLFCLPKGMPMKIEKGRNAGQEDSLFKQWKGRNFWMADLARYVNGDPRELPVVPESRDRAAE